MAAMQVQIQALLTGGVGVERGRREEEVGRVNIEVAKPQLFDGTASKVVGFVMGCKLYIRNKLVRAIVEA